MGFQESFKALSDPTRREILNLLRTGPLSAGELLEHFSMTGASPLPSSVHLKKRRTHR